MYKFILLGKRNKVKPKTLVVNQETHALIKSYAAINKLSVIEATHILLGKGLGAVNGLSKEEIDQIGC